MAQAKAVQLQYGLLREVEEFLSTEKLLPFINGEYVQPTHQETFQTVDPGSGEVLAEVAACGAQEIEQAVQAADKAFRESSWAKLPANERAVFLHRLADLVEKKKEVLAQFPGHDAAGAVGVWASAAGPDPAAALVPLPPPGQLGHGRGCRVPASGSATQAGPLRDPSTPRPNHPR
jgi:hypothetical protein